MSKQTNQRLHRLVKAATHESVTADILTETKAGFAQRRLNDRDLFSYLYEDEQPHFVFYAESQTPTFYGPNTPTELNRSRRYKVMHLVTDTRWLMVAGNRNGDESCSLPLNSISAVNYDTEGRISDRLSNNRIVLETDRAFVDIPISNDFDTADFEELLSYLESAVNATPLGVKLDPEEAGYTVDGVDSYQPNRETIARLLDDVPADAEAEANEIIQEASDTEELVTQLNTLIEEYEEDEQTLDDVVDDAQTVDGLRERVESPVERMQRHAEERFEEAKTTMAAADPNEVGRWGLGVGQAALPLAVAAPYSTPALILASLAAGGGLGLYASGRDESVLDDVDPEELAVHAMALADEGQDLKHINGEAAGAVLGAFSYLGRVVSPDRYAHWVVKADPAALLEGAEWGAQYTSQSESGASTRQGALAGAGLGLLYSYTQSEQADSHAAVRESLDDDLYKEYLEELAQNGLSLPV